MIKKEFNPYFEKITDRIIIATIKLEHRNLKVIVIYAPTLKNCEKDPIYITYRIQLPKQKHVSVRG